MQGPWSRVGLVGLGAGLTCGFLVGGGQSIAQVPTNSPPLVAQASNGKVEADRLYKLGVQQVERNENVAALVSLQQSLNLYRELGDRTGQMDASRYMGWAQHQLKKHPQALEQFQASLTIARQINSRSGEAKGLNGVAAVHENLKEIDKALVNYETARVIASEIKEVKLEALILGNMTNAYRTAGNWPKAIQSAEKNLALQRALKANDLATNLLLTLGLLHQKQKNYPQAIDYYEQYLTGMRQQPTFKEEALVLKLIGDLYRSQTPSKENSEKAIKYYNESLKIAEQTRNESDINHALHGLGLVYLNNDGGLYNFRQATEYLEKALAGWKQLNNQVMEANALTLLGSLYVGAVGNDGKTWCDQGLEYLEKGVALLASLKDQSAEAEARTALARCYQDTKQYQKAISTQEQGLLLAQKSQNRLQEGLSAIDLAKSYRLLGNLSKAELLSQQGLTALREIKNYKWEVYALDEISKIYVALGQGQKAIEAQNRRMTIAYTHDINLMSYGFNATMINVEKAKQFNFLTYRDQEENRLRAQLARHKLSTNLLDLLGPKATDPKQPGFFAPAAMSGKVRDSLTLLGDAYAEARQYPQAVGFYKSALNEDIEKGDSVGMVDIDLLTKLGNILQRIDRMQEAESYLRLALKHGEAFRTGIGYGRDTEKKKGADATRIFLADRKTRNFKQLQQLLVRQNRSNEALETAEEARARTFVELLAARTTGLSLGDKLPTAPKLDGMRQIAKQRNATLVQYSIVDDNLLYIWVIKPTGVVSFRSTSAPSSESLSQLVSNSRSEMG
jgi:tetratricopeptide (TPR) repeat protein